MGVPVEIAVDAAATLGEGPVWHPDTGELLWVDILPGLVHRYRPDSGTDQVVEVGAPVGALAPRRDGGFVLAMEYGFAVVGADWDGVTRFAAVRHPEPGPALRFNDGKCDPAGRFLAGTMAYDVTPGAGSLYRLEPDGRVEVLLAGVTISNGLAWSADGRTMYYIDSPTQRVDRFDYDTGTGQLANRRPVVDIPVAHGMPDGMAIDVDGCLWVAMYGAGTLHRYTPDGRLDRTVAFPARNLTCPAFGGPDLGTLFVTSAASDGEAHAGALFVCEPGVQGLAPDRFAG